MTSLFVYRPKTESNNIQQPSPTPNNSSVSPSNKRKRKRSNINITPEYLKSLGIPIFEDNVYDNSYLYDPPPSPKPSPPLPKSPIKITKTLASTRAKRIRRRATPFHLQHSNNNKNKNTSSTANNNSESSSDSDFSFYESDCDDSLPFSINISPINVKLDPSIIRKIKSLPQNLHPDTNNNHTSSTSRGGNHNVEPLSFSSDGSPTDTGTSSKNTLFSAPLSPRSRRRNTNRVGKGSSSSTRRSRKMTLDNLDPLTKLFFDHAKEITQNLMDHEKGEFFNELVMSDFSRFEWHEVIKQIVDLDTVNRQLLHGQYFNDDTYIISSFNQWKSDIKTVFENFAIVYGPESAKKNPTTNTKRHRLMMELDDDDDAFPYSAIYNDCYEMLTFFNEELIEMQKQIKRTTKLNADWNRNKDGKYSQYVRDRQAIMDMIYDKEMDDCRDRDLQCMDLILMVPKRRLQLEHGEFNKKYMDVLPRKALHKLARRGFNVNNRRGVHGTALREQKKYFWTHWNHERNSMDVVRKKMQKETLRTGRSRNFNNRSHADEVTSDSNTDGR